MDIFDLRFGFYTKFPYISLIPRSGHGKGSEKYRFEVQKSNNEILGHLRKSKKNITNRRGSNNIIGDQRISWNITENLRKLVRDS